MKHMTVTRVIAALLLAAANAAAHAAEGQMTLSSGAEFTSGKYGGTESTDIAVVPTSAKYENGPWVLKLMVPYIRITGPSNVVSAGEDRLVTSTNGSNARRTESGLGDIVASTFYNVLDGRTASLGLDLGGKVKFGTGDSARGLGTGKNDYSLQADAFKPINAFTAFGSLGYRWYGDPEGIELRNVFYGAIGGLYKVSQPLTVGLAYDFREPIVTDGAAVKEWTAFVSHRLSGSWKVQYYVIKGFADASPDFGAGLTLGYTY